MSQKPNGITIVEAPATPPLDYSLSLSRTPTGWLGRAWPTLTTLAVLAALGAGGHATGWKLPRFSALTGAAAPADDWCPAHSVPESICVECNQTLLPRAQSHGWCRKHGVHECPECHPDVAQVEGPPRPRQYDTEKALNLNERAENSSRCKLHQRRIQFASLAAVRKVGVDVDLVQELPMVEWVPASGVISYDQTQVARLSARVPGTIWRVEKKVGDAVREGDVLVIVEAAEVGRAKAELLQAIVQLKARGKILEGMQRAALSGALAERQFREAETALSEARIRVLGAQQALINLGLPTDVEELKTLTEERMAQQVQFLGLPASLAAALDPTRTTANLIPVRSPLDGVVATREVVPGESVDVNRVLFVIANTEKMWLNLDVRQEDARHLTLRQDVRFRPDGGGPERSGPVSWISTAIDDRTRTVKVRVELPNLDGRLRANTFGAGRIILREEKNAVVVPRESVHWEGCCHVVFVRDRNFLKEDAPKVFHTREVRLGARDEKYAEVLAGVLPGEVVAARGSAVLRSELLKNNLGAG